jgi:hypothetical protein
MATAKKTTKKAVAPTVKRRPALTPLERVHFAVRDGFGDGTKFTIDEMAESTELTVAALQPVMDDLERAGGFDKVESRNGVWYRAT